MPIAIIATITLLVIAYVIYKKRSVILEKISSADKESRTNPVSHFTGLGMLVGTCLGITLGESIFGDTGTGLAIGMCFGLAIGTAVGAEAKKKQDREAK